MIEGITLEKKENYAILMVDVPKTRNALSVPIVEYMTELVDAVIADKSMHCLVVTGGGPKSFIAGGGYFPAGQDDPGGLPLAKDIVNRKHTLRNTLQMRKIWPNIKS